jgi:tRNA1(Val) A37 N6-methylase TrmN6
VSLRFGSISLRFVHGDPAKPAIRVLVQARKDNRAPLRALAPIVLNESGGGFTAEAEAIHRDLAPIVMS